VSSVAIGAAGARKDQTVTRINVYIGDATAAAARADAKAKGQSISTWFERAAKSALYDAAMEPAKAEYRASMRRSDTILRARGHKATKA
jgi:hypothetical protein